MSIDKLKFNTLSQILNFGVWSWNLKTHHFHLNDFFLLSFDHPEDEFDQKFKTFFSWIKPEDREKFKAAVDLHLREDIPFNLAIHLQDASNDLIEYEISANSIRNPETNEPELMIGTLESRSNSEEESDFDSIIAERQQALTHASKMSSLGEMAGGVAHEINNPLAIITGKANQLKRSAERGNLKPEKVVDFCETIEKTARRIAEIVQGLRSIAHDGNQDAFIETSVKQLIEEILMLCRERFKDHGVNLIVSDIDAEMVIECQNIQVSQAILNLLNNSREAVQKLEERWIKIDATDWDDFVEISITDSGTGLPQKILQKAMQPFFTTKDIGSGTGLGLSIAKSIAEDHNGSLFFDTESQNTCVILRVPKQHGQDFHAKEPEKSPSNHEEKKVA